MKTRGPPLIENLDNSILDATKLRETVATHQVFLQSEAEKLVEDLSLLQDVIDMKTDVAISHGILRTGKESLLYWKKSMDFKKESLVNFEQ